MYKQFKFVTSVDVLPSKSQALCKYFKRVGNDCKLLEFFVTLKLRTIPKDLADV